MSKRCATSRPSGRRSGSNPSGLTLIEVTAALLVLSVLLTGVLLAKDRSRMQWRAAQRRIDAIAMLDSLLTQWTDDATFQWRAGEGPVPDHPDWRWFVTLSDRADAAAWQCRVATIAIVDRAGDEVLAQVQMLVPKPLEAKENGNKR